MAAAACKAGVSVRLDGKENPAVRMLMNVPHPAACVNISASISQAPTVAFVIGASSLLSKVDASETSALVNKTASMEFVETGSASADQVGKVPAVTKT